MFYPSILRNLYSFRNSFVSKASQLLQPKCARTTTIGRFFSDFASNDTQPKTNRTGAIVITCLSNNIFLTCSHNGKLLFKLSSGMVGYKGASKVTEEAALAICDNLFLKLKEKGIDSVKLDFRGVNKGRPILLGQIRKTGLKVTEIMDSTGVPFNGCRPPKARRL